jgi:HK97 family phage major capsid protein
MSDSRIRSMMFSSETPVQRWFGHEILDHSPKSVRMDFLNSGRAPFLLNHDMRQQVGIVPKATIADRKGRADVRFGRSSVATDALQNVDDEILVNTSVGYRVHSMMLESTVDGEDTYRSMDWEPIEVSGVAIPADPSVGFGRAALPIDAGPPGTISEVKPEAGPAPASSSSTPEIQPPATTAAIRGVTTVTTETTPVAGATAELKPVNAVDADRERREAISNLCRANGIDSRAEAEWINDPFKWTWRAISDQILSIKEERTKHNPTVDNALGLSRSETQKYSLFRAIRHLKNPASPKYREEARFEIECTEALAKRGTERSSESSILIPSEILVRPMAPEVMGRAMATQPGSKGGYMVNVENMGFLEILRNRSVANAMGARSLSGLVGNVMFPRQTGKSTVTWQGGEGVSVTATDQALGQLSMTPKTAIIVTDVSEQLLRQASPSAEQFVMADLAASIAIDGVDAAVINGTGGSQPLGIKNTTGITSAQDAATFSYLKALAFPVAAGAVNAIRGNPGWVTNIAGAAIAMQRQRFTSTDSPLWEGNLLDGSLVGFRAMSSEQLASGNLIFGSWDEVVIGDWGVLELSTDNGGTRFNQAQVGIRALWMVDVLLRYPQAFVVSVNLS